MSPLLLVIIFFLLSIITQSSINEYKFCPEPQQFATLEDFYTTKKSGNIKSIEPLYRVWLTDAHNTMGAKCLDGTIPAFYFRPGTGNGTSKWNIELEGGGWCAGIGEKVSGLSDCYERAMNENVGSSKTWLPYMNSVQYMSDDPTQNPLSYNWNTVYIKYCDGASFTGNNETTVTYNNLTLYFRGWRILNGAFMLLQNEYGFNKNIITDLIFSGCSAGALGAYIHAQYIHDEWINPNKTRFMVMPDAGFFLEYEGPNKFITGIKWGYYNQNVSIAMNKGCMEYYKQTNDQWKCMFAQNISPFILLPLPGVFALQSQYDSFQIKFELDTNTSDYSAINQYGMNVTETLINDFISVPEGYRAAFFDSCSHHCGTSWTYTSITIHNMSARQAAVKWYYNTDPFYPNFWYGNKSYPCETCGCP